VHDFGDAAAEARVSDRLRLVRFLLSRVRAAGGARRARSHRSDHRALVKHLGKGKIAYAVRDDPTTGTLTADWTVWRTGDFSFEVMSGRREDIIDLLAFSERQNKPSLLRRSGAHTWIHSLPYKFRFTRSKIYVSVIPVCGIGYTVGLIGAVMGLGGGFLLVPMLIYILRVPTATVIGTAATLTSATMALATVMHAITNQLVDATLALILMVGGVIGAQFGARAAQNMPAERLRFLLGFLILAVGLISQPDNLYSMRALGTDG
jgi:hypothetical protein